MDICLKIFLAVSFLFLTESQKRKNTSEIVVVISDFNGYIHKYDLKSKTMTTLPISDRGQGPEALDFDPTTAKLYWTNIRADTVKRANLDGSEEETLITNIETPRGIVVDYTRQILFYTEERDDIIGKMYLKNRTRSTILRTGMDRPLAITVDMEDQIVYWTDIGRTPKIEKVNYDGTKREVISSKDMKWPIALALDAERENLFWCDGSVKKISYINLLTRARTTVVYNSLTHYYDLNYVDGIIFFIDLKKRDTFQTMLPNGTDIKTYRLNKSLSKWRKLRVVKVLTCNDMTWGPDCEHNCAHCVNNTICDKLSGICPDGCEPGFQFGTCDEECPKGFYGSNCSKTCGHCHDLDTCDPENGLCMFGCAAGWDGMYCARECAHGSHGLKCESSCGHCLHGAPCDKRNGNCTAGCEPGWQGSSCEQECDDGTFGRDCQFECQCCDGAVCHKVTGKCPRKNVTARVCPDDKWGANCDTPCGKCRNGEPCNETIGACVNGCEAGWEGELCEKKCSKGFYGLQCAQACQCSVVQLCDRISGSCYDAWTPQPQQAQPLVQYNDTPITTGLTVAVVILGLLLVVAVFVIFKRRRSPPIAKAGSQHSLSKDPILTNSREPLVQM